MAQISQLDVAQLSDRDLKLAAVLLNDAASRSGGDPIGGLWRQLSVAVVHAHRERRQLLLRAEADLLEDEEEGALLDEDPDTQRIIRESGDPSP